MDSTALISLPDAVDRHRSGGKAATLAALSKAGFPVPAGFVVTAAGPRDPGFDDAVRRRARQLGGDTFAVRSSAAAEDLPDASYAGLYETCLDVPVDALADTVRRCFAAADTDRVRAYHARPDETAGMAVLVQAMVDAVAAGVAFTADPVTGDPRQTLVTAVAGLGESLVSGHADGEEWRISTDAGPARTRTDSAAPVLTSEQATAVADLARQAAEHQRRPQDIEWAIDRTGRLWLLQARPMTALPEPVTWAPPGPGLWMRNFRLGEWLPEAVTPLFATWLLPALEDGYLDGMQASLGVRVPFRYALVNGWYYNATPLPRPRLLAPVLRRGRTVRMLYHALINVSRDPAAADRAALAGLHRMWRTEQSPRYRRLVAAAQAEATTAGPQRLGELIDALGREAGQALWYLAVVGGSAWKMEARLTRFLHRHLPTENAPVLLAGLPGIASGVAGHAVYNLDWYFPTAGELGTTPGRAGPHHTDPAARREDAERRCRAVLTGRPRLHAQFQQLLDVSRRYAVIREAQVRELTLAWPVLRDCARRLGAHLTGVGVLDTADDIFFCTRQQVTDARPLAGAVTERRQRWERQRRLAAPLTLGRPPRLVGDVIDRAVTRARGPITDAEDVIIGQPASAGRAIGAVRILAGPADFPSFRDGEVLTVKATTPAWTPLFGRAAAVVTDTGTLAAHASLIAREYGIPAVVGTGHATHRLHTGQVVTVDGTTGTVTVRADLTADFYSASIESMTTDPSSLPARARLHAALGDPARLAIVDALTLGDASPGEIADDLSMPTNLVAHHVKVLQEAGLVTRSRSEGDRRRTYLKLVPGALTALAFPGLGDPGRVVFVCTHNSARSQLAAALWRDRVGSDADCAGTQPAPRVHPRAVRVAHRHGLTLDPARTAHVDDVVRDDDLIIAVCDNAHEGLTGPIRPRLHWSVPDPARVDTDEAFEAAYSELADRIERVAAS